VDERLNYLHMNPVEAGIVEEAEAYCYSSARDYAEMKGMLDVVLIE
jgi:putative transposase